MCYNYDGEHMKKLIVLLLMAMLCGCGNKTLNCSYNLDNVQYGYHVNRHYLITYKGEYVKKVTIDEEIKTDTDDMTNYFVDSNKAMYQDYQNRYKGYDYTIDTKNNIVTSHVDMDYKKMDLEEYISDNKNYDKYYVGNHNFRVKGLIKKLEDLGATCK